MAVRDEEGQSLLEFLLVLPAMVGIVLVLLRVNQAIQVSIVNQQYARMHALWLAFNSPVYPQLRLRQTLVTQQENEMSILVSGNQAPVDGSADNPVAATSYIARRRGIPDKGDKTAAKRANVRIRDSVTLCTQPVVVQGKAGQVPILPLDPTFHATGPYNLTEEPHQFDYCRSSMPFTLGPDGGDDT